MPVDDDMYDIITYFFLHLLIWGYACYSCCAITVTVHTCQRLIMVSSLLEGEDILHERITKYLLIYSLFILYLLIKFQNIRPFYFTLLI